MWLCPIDDKHCWAIAQTRLWRSILEPARKTSRTLRRSAMFAGGIAIDD